MTVSVEWCLQSADWWELRRPLKARWSVSRHFTTRFGYEEREREVGEWTVIGDLVFIYCRVDFLRSGEMTDSLIIEWNWSEVRDRLTILVVEEVRTEVHTFRSQAGIGSESDCLLGQLKSILDISEWDVGLKEEKLEGSVGGQGACGDEVEILLVKFGYVVRKEVSKICQQEDDN